MGARRYGVDTGRFLQQDMFANALGDLGLTLDPLSQNSYALAGGNPVSFVEIDGHMVTADGGGGSSLGSAAYCGQEALEILTTRTAGTQVRCDPRVPLLDGPPSGGQLRVDVQHLQRLGTAHVARVRPQEVVEL